MKVLMINHFTQTPDEKGNGRFNYLANLLTTEDIDVEMISTTFSHRKKKQRIISNELLNKIKYKLSLVYEPGYKKNISLKRFYSHYIFGRNVNKYLNDNVDLPDLVYLSVPSLSVGNQVAKYCKNNNIKLIIDIQDLWPEAFQMVFNIPIISNIIYYPLRKMADNIYFQADYIIAVSESYVNKAKFVNKKINNSAVIYLGTDKDDFDSYIDLKNMKKELGKIKMAYIGTLGSSYDLSLVFKALRKIDKKTINNLEFIIMGDGPEKEKFIKESKDLPVIFTGALDYSEMVFSLSQCDIAINPIKKGAAGSIINKHMDYAMASLPVINTQECIEYRNLLKKYNAGINCKCNNINDLADAIQLLCNNAELRQRLGKNSRLMAEDLFDRKKTYNEILDIMKG